MKNLKKTLAVVLAFAMVLSMSVINTLAFADVAEGTAVSEAVNILANLNIINGFEDGTFKPAETVTRSQMAAIVCRMLGYESQAQSSKGATVFDDVAADHWASGYINVAQAQQIINGYGNGKFGPEDKVTYEQAIKMIVVALGREIEAQSKGGYPTGYLAVASTQGISKNANGRVGDAAPRGTIAVLAYNALEVELMAQTSWSTGTAGNGFEGTGETILSQYLDVMKIEATVAGTALTGLAADGYDPEADAKVTFTNAKKWNLNGNSEDVSIDPINASLIEDTDKYLGKRVIAYVGTEADENTNEVMLYAMAEKQGANASLTLNVAQLVENPGTKYDGKLVYKKAGSNTKYDVKLNIQESYVNYADGDEPTNTDEVIALFANDEDVVVGGTLELIDTIAAEPGYETIKVVAYDSEAVIEEVENDEADYFFTTYTNAGLDSIDTESEEDLVVIYKDGAVAEASAIAAGDTVSIVEIHDTVRALYVSSKTVTGSVDGWKDDKVEIAGEEYGVSALAEENEGIDIEELKNVEGIFYLNVDGQIAYYDGSAAKGAVALILNSGKGEGMGAKYYATIVTADGEVKAYNYATKVSYTGTVFVEDEENEGEFIEETVTNAAKTNATAHEAVAALMSDAVTANEVYATVADASDLLFEVKIKNGEIKELKAVSVANASGKYNKDTQALGAKSFDETSVMFALPAASDERLEEEDVKVGKVIDMLVDEEIYSNIGLASFENRIYKTALGFNLTTSIALDSAAIVVTDKYVKSYDDEDATVIKGLQDGKDVEIWFYDSEDLTFAGTADEEIELGDVILVGALEDDKFATDYMVLVDISEADYEEAAGNFGEVEIGDKFIYGAQVATGSDKNYIWFAEDMGAITEAEGGAYYLTMQNGVNTVLVDYTKDEEEPTIAKKTLSKSIIGATQKYVSYVFVRVYDEQIMDVIVYKTNVPEVEEEIEDEE